MAKDAARCTGRLLTADAFLSFETPGRDERSIQHESTRLLPRTDVRRCPCLGQSQPRLKVYHLLRVAREHPPNEQIGTRAIVGVQSTSIDENAPDPIASAARAADDGPVRVRPSRGPTRLGGDVTTGRRGSFPGSVMFDGDDEVTGSGRIQRRCPTQGWPLAWLRGAT